MCVGGKVWGKRPASAGGAPWGKKGGNMVYMGKNCPFMRGTTALKPTMDGVGMGENCPFMHEKRLLYSIDLLGGGAGKWGKNAPTLSIRPHVFQKRKK